ncbi:LOW QUALITY PROTEIN: adhesion G-protein coupled receptor F3 [Dugong dugon]
MVCSSALLLLLAVTLPLLGLPAVPASQPGQSQAGGESEQQLDQESGAFKSVLVSVYVRLDFSKKTWPQELSMTLTLPSAYTSSSPRTLTGLSIMTECNASQDGHFCCDCLSEYQWNASVCSHHPRCQTSHNHQPCICLIFSHPEPTYCQLLLTGEEGWELETGSSPAVPLDRRKFQLLQRFTGPELETKASLGLSPVRVSVSVTIIQNGDTVCPKDSLAVTWNVTKAGYVAQAPCPMDRIGMMTRSCGLDRVWGPIHSSCTDASILALLHRARLLQAGQGQPAEEVPQLLEQLPKQAVEMSSPSDLLALLDTMTFLAEVVAEARIQLNHRTLKDLLIGTDKILDLDTNSLWTPAQAQKSSASSALLLAVETLAHSLCSQDHPFFFTSNMQLQSQLLGPTFPADCRIFFSTQPPLWAEISRHSLATPVHSRATISITSLVLQKLDHLLSSNYGGLRDSLYATPGDGQAFNQGEVIMDFGDRNGTPHCVFWDHDLFQGEGGWSDGCQAQAARANSTTQCVCQHLAAFSVLMSQCSVPDSPTLELLSKLSLGASILALLVCLGVYRLVWRVVVRNKVAYFHHAALLNMVLCLLAADTCFLGASLLPPEPHSPLCLATAFLCHFLYLAAFLWMLAQALVLAHQLLFIFHQLSKHQVFPLMVVLGYLCPLRFAGGALGLYLPWGQYLKEGACWLDEKGGALYTFMGPVLAIVGMNGLVLAMAVLKLLRPSLSEGPQVEKHQALLGVIKALLFLTPIFGLTWGLGLATLVEEVSEVPHYIFTILNTSQGVYILLFGCLMDKKVQEALLFCGTAPSSTSFLVSCWLQSLSSPPESRPLTKPVSRYIAREEAKMPGIASGELGIQRVEHPAEVGQGGPRASGLLFHKEGRSF